MSKDVYYFSHDYNARNDEKITMLRAEYGAEGYGIYWMLLEMMFESTETALSHKRLKGIAISINIDITVLSGVINSCITEGLFFTDGDYFWSESLRRRKGIFQENREKKSIAGKKGMTSRWSKNKEVTAINENKNITNGYHSYNGVITKDNKVKESKVKESKIVEDNTAEKINFSDKVEKISTKKSSPKKPDFINQLIDIFSAEYKKVKGIDYDVTSLGKERNNMQAILTNYKEKNPNANTEKALIDFKDFFEKCLTVTDAWLIDNCTIPHINSQFAKYKAQIYGKKAEPKKALTTTKTERKEQLIQDWNSGKIFENLNKNIKSGVKNETKLQLPSGNA